MRISPINFDITLTGDGWTLSGNSSTGRSLSISGGNISIVGGSGRQYIFPNMSDTLVGIGTSITGDITGSLSATSVTGIRGIQIDSNTIAQNGFVFFYKGDRWTASAFKGDITGSVTSMNVTGIRGIVVSPVAPTLNQVLLYDGNKYTPSSVTVSWSSVTSSCNMIVNTGFICASASTAISATLPSSVTVGSIFWLTARTSPGWILNQLASQYVIMGNSKTTVGVNGYIISSSSGDVVQLLCTSANTEFMVVSSIGNFTII